MQRKIFLFDVETTGLDPSRNAIVQLSARWVIDDEPLQVLNLLIAPHEGAVIDDAALKVHGMSRKEINAFTPPETAHRMITDFMCLHIDKYDPEDKAYPMGFNVAFDIAFLSCFFERMDDKYIGSFLARNRALDPLYLGRILHYHGWFPDIANMKLETLYKALYGTTLQQAHDALADLNATWRIWKTLCGMCGLYTPAHETVTPPAPEDLPESPDPFGGEIYPLEEGNDAA